MTDLHDAEAAFRARGERPAGTVQRPGFLHGPGRAVPPRHRRRDAAEPAPPRARGHAHHFGGVPAWLAARLEDYTSAIPAPMKPRRWRASRSGSRIRPAPGHRRPGLGSLAGLDRQRHIETYLARPPSPRRSRGGQPIGDGEQRNRIITVGRFLDDIAEWGWPDAPARRLVFTRDMPKLPRPLPRYLPADADRLIGEALEESPNRLFADALLLARATGVRIGELLDLELDCVHEVPGTAPG